MQETEATQIVLGALNLQQTLEMERLQCRADALDLSANEYASVSFSERQPLLQL